MKDPLVIIPQISMTTVIHGSSLLNSDHMNFLECGGRPSRRTLDLGKNFHPLLRIENFTIKHIIHPTPTIVRFRYFLLFRSVYSPASALRNLFICAGLSLLESIYGCLTSAVSGILYNL